jgi:DNA-binding CsgD family transcriptional regulator
MDRTRSLIAMGLLLQSGIPANVLSVLESLRCGGFLLDLRGRVLSLNLLALSCLGDGLVLGGERLCATDRETDRRLQYLVGSTLSPGDGVDRPTSVAVRRPSRLPLVVRTHRLNEYADPVPSSASLLLLVLDPELRPEPPREVLTQTFGLTPAEAEVAIGVVSGRSLSKIASDRGIKIGTVRAHLKTVFSKTHTHGQADLTGVLTRLAFLVPQTDRKTLQS